VSAARPARIAPPAAPAARRRRRLDALDAAVVALLLLGGVLMLMPFVWMLSTSLRDARDSFTLPPQWLPREPDLDNYATVLDQLPFVQFAINSLKIAALITLGQLATCTSRSSFRR
jgi:ABC-type glycerol-3-phosphate transport system permease component